MTVRLWLADLDEDGPEFWLSPDEVARRDRFVFPVHRRRFARGRGLLRQVLAEVLGVAPSTLAFSYNAYGRPSLPDVHFNLSHAETQLLIAVGPAELGVDIEATGRVDDLHGVARTAFSVSELAAWQAAPDPVEAFYRLWTRKEAVMKASGLGFALGSRDFSLTLAPGPQLHGPYTVLDLPAPAGYQAALAFAGPLPAVVTETL